MPTYEVRRRTVMATAVVTAANETEARCLARDAFQQDAAIAALAADVTRQPHLEPYDQERDDRLDFLPADDPRDLERPFAGDWSDL